MALNSGALGQAAAGDVARTDHNLVTSAIDNGFPLQVVDGGTGATTLTDGGVLLGNGTSSIQSLAVTTDGSIIVGDGTTDPTTLTAFTSSTGTLKHEKGGIETDISAIADGGMVVGTGTGTMAIRASALTGGASGYIKHELGGIEADISAVAIGDIVVGTGTGSMALVTSTGHSDGDVLTRQADGSVDYESISTAFTVVSKATGDSPYSASWGELVLCNTSGGNLEVDLPAAGSNGGKTIHIKHVTAGNTLTIDGNSSETIDGSATVTDTTAGNSYLVASDGTNVVII